MISAKEANALSMSNRNTKAPTSKFLDYDIEMYVKLACEKGATDIRLVVVPSDLDQLVKELTELGYVVSHTHPEPRSLVTVTISWD